MVGYNKGLSRQRIIGQYLFTFQPIKNHLKEFLPGTLIILSLDYGFGDQGGPIYYSGGRLSVAVARNIIFVHILGKGAGQEESQRTIIAIVIGGDARGADSVTSSAASSEPTFPRLSMRRSWVL